MAPGSAGLALKAAALISVLVLLVVPSAGRCGQSPPPPSPPPPAPTPPPPAPLPLTPTPAPGPGPMISCDDCWSQCRMRCDAFVHETCSDDCEHTGRSCEDGCKASAIEDCKARGDCPDAGTCDCNTAEPYEGCLHGCSPMPCMTCEGAVGRDCSSNCSKQCSAPNCIPSSL